MSTPYDGLIVRLNRIADEAINFWGSLTQGAAIREVAAGLKASAAETQKYIGELQGKHDALLSTLAHQSNEIAARDRAIEKLAAERVELHLGLQDAWPYVHSWSTISSIKDRLAGLLRKHGAFDPFDPPPPLGLRPKFVYEEMDPPGSPHDRAVEIGSAMARYAHVGAAVPFGWVTELLQRIAEIKPKPSEINMTINVDMSAVRAEVAVMAADLKLASEALARVGGVR